MTAAIESKLWATDGTYDDHDSKKYDTIQSFQVVGPTGY